MNNLNPYLRYIDITSYLPNKDFVKAYDCRFFFVLSGVGEFRTEQATFHLSENTLVYYPSGSSYMLVSSVEHPLTFVTVNFDFTRSYPERVATLRPVKVHDFSKELERPTYTELSDDRFCSTFIMERAFTLRDDFIALNSHFGKGEVYTKELCSAQLSCIILKILNHFHTEGHENQLIKKVEDYVSANHSGKLNNNAVASHLGYHPYYLSSLFKSYTGKTLHQYITDVRLKHGCELLLHTDLSIGEIATRCGFQNANHFSVKFKKRYKESPTKWREINNIV